MTDAPHRIWADEDTLFKGPGHTDRAKPYILATPAALAASPEGKALIREAEARGMERAAKLVDRRAEEYDRDFGIYDYTTGVTEYPGTGSESMEEWETISGIIRAEAAAIRAAKGEPE